MELAKKQTQRQYFDIIILSMIMFYPELSKYIWKAVNIFSSIVGISISSAAISLTVWALIILVFFNVFMQRLKAVDFAVYLVAVMFISVFYFFPSHGKFTSQRYIELIFTVMPMYLCGRIYKYNDSDKKWLMNIAVVTLLLSMYYTFINVGENEMLERGDMYASYLALPVVLLLISSFFDKRFKWHIPFGVIGIIYIFSLGSRGPILCIAVFCLLMIIKIFKAKRFIALACVLAVAVFAFVSSNLYERTIVSMAKSFQNIGLSTRIIDFIAEDNITDDSERSGLEEKILAGIKKHPFDANGPYYDRAIVSGDFDTEAQSVESDGTYSHNLFLELWANYGMVLGSIFALFIVLGLLRLLKRTSKDAAYISALFVASVFVRLMVSSSYLLLPEFFFLLGLCVNKQFLSSKNSDVLKKEERI